VLEQPGVAGHQRRGGEAHRLPQGEVPRHHRQHRPQWTVDGVGPAGVDRGRVGGGLIGQEALGVLGVEPAGGGALGRLGLGRGQRLAHLGGHHRGYAVALGVEQVGGGPHPGGPLGEAGAAQHLEVTGGPADAQVDLGLGHRVEPLHNLAGRRVRGGNRHDVGLSG
jgi:hypothetical protein